MTYKQCRIPKLIENKNGVKIPVFIKIGITEMRYIKDGDCYYRDGGQWNLNYTIKEDGKLYANDRTIKHIHGNELKPITKKEWVKGNLGYTPSNSIIKRDLGLVSVCTCCGQELL